MYDQVEDEWEIPHTKEEKSPMEETTTPVTYVQSLQLEFAVSPRGKFIQAQALYYGIKALCKVEGVMREESNISDMVYLLDTVYPGYEGIFDHIERDIRH
jgi:hypothetical protein|tara:strand:- start:133 stop:432 length:300 start_codon:yes stop_codon:yes gene_type:complete